MLELCEACRRYVRAGSDTCPFCGADHVPAPVPPRRRARTRLALAGGAALLAAACGGGQPAGEGGGEGGPGGGGEEASCAGTCGSHHHPDCMDDEVDPCEAPPYGAPPVDELV